EEIDAILRRFERDESGLLARRRVEIAEAAQNRRPDNQSAKPKTYATLQEAQAAADELSQYLSPNQDVKIGGSNGAFTVSVVTRKGSEVYDLGGGRQLLIVGDRVFIRDPESPYWREIGLSP